jgi:Ras-related protein Rab-8A
MFVDTKGAIATLAWDFKAKNITLPQKEGDLTPDTVKLYIWDTAGQERFRHIARIYYQDVKAAMICFDLSDEDSFKNVTYWLSDLDRHAPENIVKLLIGNKADLVEKEDEKDSVSS